MTQAEAERPARWLVSAAAVGGFATLLALAPQRIAVSVTAVILLLAVAVWTVAVPSRWVMGFLICALLLPPLPIAMGNTGPHPSLMFAAIGAFAGTLRMASWRVSAGSLTSAMISYFLVLTASLAPAVWYSGAAVAAASLARVLLFGIALYVFFYTAYGPSATETPDPLHQTRILFRCGVLSALFACLDFYFQFPAPASFSPQFVWLSSGIYRRAQGIFYEASTLGNLCAFFLTMVAVAVVRPKLKLGLSRWTLLVGAAVFSLALIFSYSRSSVLNLLIALATLIYLRHADRRRNHLAVVLLISGFAGAAAAYFIFPGFFGAYLWRWWGSAAYLFESPGQILSGRWESWSMLYQYLLHHPLTMLVGVGYKTLPYSRLVAGQAVIVDNMYLSLLAEMGIVGLAALLWFNFNILRASYRAAHDSDARVSFHGTWIFCFWVGQVVQMASGDLLTYWRILPLYLWVLAISLRVDT
jgi:hypothetical protein